VRGSYSSRRAPSDVSSTRASSIARSRRRLPSSQDLSDISRQPCRPPDLSCPFPGQSSLCRSDPMSTTEPPQGCREGSQQSLGLTLPDQSAHPTRSARYSAAAAGACACASSAKNCSRRQSPPSTRRFPACREPERDLGENDANRTMRIIPRVRNFRFVDHPPGTVR
jgi:hypothetical protein